MRTGATGEERAEQKRILREVYGKEYDPKRHDSFVIRYTQQKEAEALKAWMKRRGVK